MKKFHITALIIIALIIVAAWAGWGYCVPKFAGNRDYSKTGVYGDSYGALNTLFTGLAFLGVVYTILQQREQLADAKQELKDSSEANQKQQFEATFFQLLGLLTTTINSMDRHKEKIVLQGRDALTEFASQMLRNLRSSPRSSIEAERLAHIEADYMRFYSTSNTDLAHYFRILYRILRWIEDSKIQDAAEYVKIFRAQLSSQELVLLFYNSLTPIGADMKRLVLKYGLLKHVADEHLAYPEDKALYSSDAFRMKPPV